MEKTLEKEELMEELMEQLGKINSLLKENEIDISSMKESILNIKNEEIRLKKIYPDLCILEQVRVNIEMNKKNIAECEEDDKDTIAAFEGMIKALENQVSSILKKLEGSAVLDKKDYEIKMRSIQEEKLKIPDINLQIEQKENENLKLEEKKREVENKIREFQDDKNKDTDEIGKIQDKNIIISENYGVNQVDLGEVNQDMLSGLYGSNSVEFGKGSHEELGRNEREAIKVEYESREERNVTKRDLKKVGSMENVGNTSELASFIDYEEEPIEESNEVIVEKKEIKKEEEIDDIIENMLIDLKSIVRKFEEIISESNDSSLNKNVIYLKNKFGQKVYNYLFDIINKFVDKRKEIKELEGKLKVLTKEDEEKRLISLKENLVNDISRVKDLEQKFTNEVINKFNSFKEFVKKGSDDLCENNKSLKSEIDTVYSKLSEIVKKVQELKENSKESIMEAVRETDKKIDLVDKEERDLRFNVKEKLTELLNNYIEDIKSSDYCEDLIDMLGQLKQKLENEQVELSSKKTSIEEKRNSLESERKKLEEKYKVKRENDTDKQEEIALANSKEELKEELKKMMETFNILKIKYDKFSRESEGVKMEIKADIRRKDMSILKTKTKIMETSNEDKKSSKTRLIESISKYNNEYTLEFEKGLEGIKDEIDGIAKENRECKKNATNIVVVSEFEENDQLLENLKEELEKSIKKDKMMECQNALYEEEQSYVQKEIEENISQIKLEDKIDLKIDFGEIYEMENKLKEINDIKQSLYNICIKLGMEEEVKNNELKLKEQENEQDEIERKLDEIKNDKSNEENATQNEEIIVQNDKSATQNEEIIVQNDKSATQNEEIIVQNDKSVTQNEENAIQNEESVNYDKQNKLEEKTKSNSKVVASKKRNNMVGLEEYSDDVRDILLNIPWNQLVELKNMNKEYQRILYIEDLEELKNEKVQNIAKLKEQYRKSVEYAKKLYEVKKYVLAYKKGMEELAKGVKNNDKESKKEHANFMKMATKSLKVMKENGINGFEDFRDKVIKNSDAVKEILSKTKSENENLVKLMGLIESIRKVEGEIKAGIK